MKEQSCDDVCQEAPDSVVGYMETMKAVEERLQNMKLASDTMVALLK
jgi:hypothetical protein